jgi:hypothetical protein
MLQAPPSRPPSSVASSGARRAVRGGAVAVVVYGAGINAVEYYGSRRSRWR